MNQFINKFKFQLESFWEVDEESKRIILSDILKYANYHQQSFKKEIDEVKFDQNLRILSIVSEALALDTENWGEFYVDLIDDILETAKKSNRPNDILTHLQEFSYIENDSRPFVQKIVDKLYKELDSENLYIKLASIWALPNYLSNNYIDRKISITDKLRQQLYDVNWKTRVVAFKSLGYEKLLPEGYKLSLKDKLFKLIFGEPPMP